MTKDTNDEAFEANIDDVPQTAEVPADEIMNLMLDLYPEEEWSMEAINCHLLQRLSSVEANVNILTAVIQNLRLTAEPAKAAQ